MAGQCLAPESAWGGLAFFSVAFFFPSYSFWVSSHPPNPISLSPSIPPHSPICYQFKPPLMSTVVPVLGMSLSCYLT